jgi:hypothetical protein
LGHGLIAGNEATRQKEHVNKQKSEKNALHNDTSVWCLPNYISTTKYFKVRGGECAQQQARVAYP